MVTLSDTMQGVYKEDEFVIGKESQMVNILGYQRKPSPSPDQKWKLQEIKCLPTVSRIAREGKIKLYTYDELLFEAWKRPGSFPQNVIGNVFSGVKFEHVNAAVERSFFSQMDLSEYATSDQLISFCRWLHNSGIEDLADRLSKNDRFPSYLIKNLRDVQRFRNLCSGLSEKQYIDAFHLWTAEVNEAEYFLTTDKKFIQVMTKTKHMHLPCKPIPPTELLKIFNIKELDSFEFLEDQFYSIFGKRM